MTKAQHLARAANYQHDLTKAERSRDRAALARDRALLAAADKGATYEEMAAATGLSVTRVTQVLRRTRANRTTTI